MDSKNSESFFVKHIDPNPSEREINKGQKEVNPRENCLAGGKIIPVAIPPLEIVHSRSDGHRYFDITETVRKDQSVLVGRVYLENDVEARFSFGGLEIGDELDEIGLESAREFAAGDLFEHLHPGVQRGEEEPDFAQVDVRILVREVDLGDVELEAAGVSEPELVQGDYGVGIGSDLRETDLGRTVRNKKRDQKEKQKGAADHRHGRI
ncbi:hypothetical protein V6N13_086283 [Hibiscus sabdariffa]|uniref:Uncharacterized protein n=1 Tax=Hibiscus sabdariffa TaxID=183260 RepID=A0ABR2FSR0_9ROSI